MSDLRVLVVADDALTRSGLAALLSDQPGCVVVGQLGSESDLPAEVDVYLPDVLVWELGWDPTLALERLADLPEDNPPVVALLPNVAHAPEAWTAGARGLLIRDADPSSLVAVLSAVTSGMVALDPQLASSLMSTREPALVPPSTGLTSRKLEVLRFITEGLPNKSIALRLGISEHTVKFRINAMFGKLGVQSRTEAAMHATRLGLIAL